MGVGFPAYIADHMTKGVCIQGVCIQGKSASRGVCIHRCLHPGVSASMWSPSRVSLHPGHIGGERPRVCLQGGEGGWADPQDIWDTMEYSQQTGSMQPTGMLSCKLENSSNLTKKTPIFSLCLNSQPTYYETSIITIIPKKEIQQLAESCCQAPWQQ